MFVGDNFEVNLINPNKQDTEDFINTVYSLSLIPKITRTTRTAVHSATLLDNVFTNDLENKLESGLLINDISDHLPAFILIRLMNV